MACGAYLVNKPVVVMGLCREASLLEGSGDQCRMAASLYAASGLRRSFLILFDYIQPLNHAFCRLQWSVKQRLGSLFMSPLHAQLA